MQGMLSRVREIGRLLERIDAGSILPGGGGADISPLMRDGVPGLAVRTVGTHYFDWHHTRSDTTDKVKLEDLRANIAAMAVMAYVLADMPEGLRQTATSTR
jgi:N-methylhydantoinase B/oxoprolinase/acetone carboxylase alpha subunit